MKTLLLFYSLPSDNLKSGIIVTGMIPTFKFSDDEGKTKDNNNYKVYLVLREENIKYMAKNTDQSLVMIIVLLFVFIQYIDFILFPFFSCAFYYSFIRFLNIF